MMNLFEPSRISETAPRPSISEAFLWVAEHVLRKIHHCTFGRKISERPFLGILFLFLHNIHPLCIHTHMLFSRFCTLLCVLVTVHTAYTIYFVLIHHCTNSLSSLHIFVHHCTFCASLHTKTSPDRWGWVRGWVDGWMDGRKDGDRTDGWMDGRTGAQTDRQTDRETDRQAYRPDGWMDR